MNRRRAVGLALGGLLLTVLSAGADQITRVGVLDIDRVYAAYFRESRAVKELQQKQAEVLAEIGKIDEDILQLEAQKLEAEARGDRDQALRLDTDIFKKKQYRDDYRRIKMDQIRKLSEGLYKSDQFLDELLAAIQFVAESEGFSLILNKSAQFSQFFLFYTKEVDVTEKVIQELMRRSGRPGGPGR